MCFHPLTVEPCYVTAEAGQPAAPRAYPRLLGRGCYVIDLKPFMFLIHGVKCSLEPYGLDATPKSDYTTYIHVIPPLSSAALVTDNKRCHHTLPANCTSNAPSSCCSFTPVIEAGHRK